MPPAALLRLTRDNPRLAPAVLGVITVTMRTPVRLSVDLTKK